MLARPARRKALAATSTLTLALGTALTASIALPGVAGAAAPSARVEQGAGGRSIAYIAAEGQTNKLSVTATKGEGLERITYVLDDVVPIEIAPTATECGYPDSADRTKVSCTGTTLETQDPYALLFLNLEDGNDTVTYDNATDQTYYHASIDLGTGKDKYTHTGSVDGNSIHGGTGDDTITLGVAGVALAEDGNDTVHAAEGSIVFGHGGVDTIYADGDETSVDGGVGNDVIHGGAGRQHLTGGDGDDTVRGGTGSDFLYGSPGNDILYGNSGDDTIYGNSGNDKLYGGPGRDTLSGGPGTDVERQD
ncbi:calcium-binding protein [Streptomyces sp. uw30]|uniref:calcium-binding protein n=1 Tax=Streptomyces sp. uw30 TaxID=1828179 RepID=UPI0011CE348D|nr:calcium-binding protein [Streptomyces sp. uw30]TXS50199.1 calcium-binding protein [Streptomyces sp. uw30]